MLRTAEPSSNPKPTPPKEKNTGHHTGVLYLLEVQAGFEPADNGVADRGLTTWLLHQIFACHSIIAEFFSFVKGFLKFLTFYFGVLYLFLLRRYFVNVH